MSDINELDDIELTLLREELQQSLSEIQTLQGAEAITQLDIILEKRERVKELCLRKDIREYNNRAGEIMKMRSAPLSMKRKVTWCCLGLFGVLIQACVAIQFFKG